MELALLGMMLEPILMGGERWLQIQLDHMSVHSSMLTGARMSWLQRVWLQCAANAYVKD